MEGSSTSNEAGITLYPNRASSAFTLISFMIGELAIVHEEVKLPVNHSQPLSRASFQAIKKIILDRIQQKDTAPIQLNLQESITLYQLVDLSCKLIVSETENRLEELAISSLDVSKDEFQQLKINYLKTAQSLIEKMNVQYAQNDTFKNAVKGIADLD